MDGHVRWSLDEGQGILAAVALPKVVTLQRKGWASKIHLLEEHEMPNPVRIP